MSKETEALNDLRTSAIALQEKVFQFNLKSVAKCEADGIQYEDQMYTDLASSMHLVFILAESLLYNDEVIVDASVLSAISFTCEDWISFYEDIISDEPGYSTGLVREIYDFVKGLTPLITARELTLSGERAEFEAEQSESSAVTA